MNERTNESGRMNESRHEAAGWEGRKKKKRKEGRKEGRKERMK